MRLGRTVDGSGLSRGPQTYTFLGSRAGQGWRWRQRDPELTLKATCVVCGVCCGEAGVIPGRHWLALPWVTHGWLAGSLVAMGPALQRLWSGHSWDVEVITRRHRDGRVTCTEERPDPKLVI